MITPYDWQEGIGHRAQYVEGKLKHGSPVLAVSLVDGILIYTRRRQSRKVFEIYDRLAFSAVGQQSDVEAVRNAAVEFAHQEGFNRSEQDVTIQRVVTALSQPVKKAFSDFSSSPIVARSIFAEVNEVPIEDLFYVLDFDGDYGAVEGHALVGGTREAEDSAREEVRKLIGGTEANEAAVALSTLWEEMIRKADEELDFADLEHEAYLIERSSERENRFRSVSLSVKT
jgi:proteasome alpha subunit